MNDEIYENYKLAGKIAAEARKYGAGLIKPDVSLLQVANSVESKILEKGAGLAFPVNISINEIAAHYSPKHDDTSVFKKGDVVKLDIGAHVDGYIADTAITIEIETDKYQDMIKASADGLDTAIKLMRPGINLIEIGKAVQKTILSYGYKPVDNLTGHSMKRYVIHSGMSVPSVPSLLHNSKPNVGDVLAIEPFATNGAGHVSSGDGSNIYLCKESFNPRIIRNKRVKIISGKMKSKFKTLPFAQRWFEDLFPDSDISLRKLAFLGLIKHYPQLIESKKGIVTQKEHTVILTEDGCETIT
jgi:methionyl aminopeptidase